MTGGLFVPSQVSFVNPALFKKNIPDHIKVGQYYLTIDEEDIIRTTILQLYAAYVNVGTIYEDPRHIVHNGKKVNQGALCHWNIP